MFGRVTDTLTVLCEKSCAWTLEDRSEGVVPYTCYREQGMDAGRERGTLAKLSQAWS